MTEPYDQTQAYQVTDSPACQFVLTLSKAVATEVVIEKIVKDVKEYFKEKGIAEGLKPDQFELRLRKIANDKVGLGVRVPDVTGDRMSLKEFAEFLEKKGLEIIKKIMEKFKELFKKDEPFKEVETKTESLFGSGPGHGLGKGN